MADTIYNFFNFLEKKTGKTLSPEKHAVMLIKHARELANDSVLQNLGIQDRIVYAPDTLKKNERYEADDLDLRKIKHLPPFANIVKVVHQLNLDALEEIPQGFNPTVGGVLMLNSIKTIPKGFNPTVGALWMDKATSVPDSFNPTVSGNLFLPSYDFPYKTKQDLRNRFPNVGGIIQVKRKVK